MKTSTQLKALVRNLAKSKNVEAEIVLRSYMLERFLERVSVSQYKNDFVLKGGMLVSAMVGINARTTMDMDATIKGQALTETRIREIIENILSIPIDDNVILSFRKIEEIREEADYPGYRVSVDAILDKTRQTMHIDITTGDFITPREIEYNFKLMFENRTISILAYNLETVLAEKFETIITRGLANTRMRDFYDIYVLSATRRIDAVTFRAALEKTAAKRKTIGQIMEAESVVDRIATSRIMTDLWDRYRKNYNYASEITWEMAIDALQELADKL